MSMIDRMRVAAVKCLQSQGYEFTLERGWYKKNVKPACDCDEVYCGCKPEARLDSPRKAKSRFFKV